MSQRNRHLHRIAATLASILSGAAKILLQIPSWILRHITSLLMLLGVVSVLILTVLTVRGALFPAEIRYNRPLLIFTIAASIAGMILWTIPRDRYQAIFANTFGWLPVVLGAISWPYWSWYGTWHPQILAGADFYATAAQVLPVLLLAAVIDVRRSGTLKTSQLVLPVVVVFLGEIDALGVLAFPHTNATSEFASVAASFTSTIIALLLAVLADIATPDENSRGATRSTRKSKIVAAQQRVRASDHNRPDSTTEPPQHH